MHLLGRPGPLLLKLSSSSSAAAASSVHSSVPLISVLAPPSGVVVEGKRGLFLL